MDRIIQSMINKIFAQRLFVVSLFFLFGLFYGCGVLQPESKVGVSSLEVYSFDASTVLADIGMGNERIFISEEDFQLQDVEIHPVTASWDLDDYRLIVEAFTKLVLDDTIENWSLTQISLLLDCTNLNSIEDAILTYYKIDKSATKPSRYVYKYSIKPNTGLFRVVKDEYYPVGNLFRPIEPSMIEIPLDVLIRVAEQNGGAETRIQELNNCEIIVTQNPQLLEYTGWVVAYTTERGERLNVFYINPETGELESGR